MSYQWRRLQFFEKLILSGDDQTKRPLKLFDPTTTSLTSSTSGHGFVFGSDNKGFIHRYSRSTNQVNQFQAFDAICLHLLCLPETNTLLAIGYDHESIDPMFNPTLKLFKFNPAVTTSSGPNQPDNNNQKSTLPTPSQELTSDFTCVRTIPLSPYLSNKTTTNEFGGERSGKLITVTCFAATDDGNNIALGCDDGSLVTIELSKTRYIGNVWFRPVPTSADGAGDAKNTKLKQQQQQQQQDTSQWPKGPITTLHYRRGLKNTFSLYLTTMSGVYVIHQTHQSLSAELLGMEGCHYHGSSLCYNSITNNISSLGELVLACPEITVFYSSEGDRLSCYFFPEHKKYIAFYNHFLIIVSDEGVPSNVDDTGFNTNPTASNTPQTNPKAHFSSPQYNSPLSTLTQQVNPAGRNAIVIYDIHSKIIVFSLKCDVICGLQVIQGNQICFITQRGEIMLLTELPLRNKMAVLLRRDLFNVALSLASSQCADKRLIIDITYKYGDYLYNKGDYEAATQHYMETIGYIEPAIIISKFLHSQRITCLTMYLEALHNKHLITCDHTTLLLTCYTKLRDLQKITSFLLQPHQLNKISAATPIETLKSIEYLTVYCNSLQIDFSHVDEMSSLTNIGEYLARILSQAGATGIGTQTSTRGSSGTNQPLNQKQLLENLSAVTTLYSTQHYHALDVYNTIRVYMECNYYYHALFAAFLLGAHEYVLYLLINIGYHHVAVQYLYSLPFHLVVWLLHQYGLQLLREHPEEVTLLCIKLICGWKRQQIFHNMVLTINHDISSTTSSECHATVDSIYKFDDLALDEHYSTFETKQRRTKELLLLQEQQQSLQTAQNASKDAVVATSTQVVGSAAAPVVGAGNKNDKNSGNSATAIAYHIYLRLAINDDGCVQIDKCVGFDSKDLTGRCTTMDSQLAHLQLLDVKQQQLQFQQQQQQDPAAIAAATTAMAQTGELSLDDFADDKMGKNAHVNSDDLTTIVEQLYISPSDFIPLFSDSPQYLQAYLEAICAHATNLYQDKQKQQVLQNQRVNRRNRANQDSSDADQLLQTQDGIFDGTSSAKSSLLSKRDSVLFLNQHETITSSLNAINSDYDYLQHLNDLGIAGMNKGQRNQQATLSFASSFDPNLDVTSLLEFPTSNIIGSTSSSAVLNTSSSQGDVLNILGIQLQTTVAADNNIWTSLVELYAELIKSLQSNPSFQQLDSNPKQSQQQPQQQQKDNTNKEDKSKSLLTLSSYKTPGELEQQVISIIKANMDHLDYSSVLVVLESYDLESSLSYLYARTRQYHSLLNLQTNRKDWYKARQVCQAYGSQQQEPSLWLMLLVKIVECYPVPNEQHRNSTQVSNPVDSNVISSNNGNNELVNLLTLCVQQVHQLALLSPLQILSLLSTSPHIPIEPIRNFLLNVITVIQQESAAFSTDAQSFAVDTANLQKQIHTLQYEPLVFKSIDCQRCKQQLTMPTIHFYCGHSFHQHCVIENDISQQKPYQQQISSLYDIISTTMNPTVPTGQPGNEFSSNPYSSLLHDPTNLAESTHQQMMLTMFNQPLEFECPLCQPEHQRLQNIATSLFGTNDYQLEPGQTAKGKQSANAVQQAQVHDKFIKRLDEASGQFSIIAEQLSRGMFVPQGYE